MVTCSRCNQYTTFTRRRRRRPTTASRTVLDRFLWLVVVGMTVCQHPYCRVQARWVEDGKILASDGEENDRFGASVAICTTGTTSTDVRIETLVVGAPGVDDNGSDSGSIYIYTRSLEEPTTADEWVEQHRVSPDDGSVEAWFGRKVACSSTTSNTVIIAVSAQGDDFLQDEEEATMIEEVGSVYTYQFAPATGELVSMDKLFSPNPLSDEGFGINVDMGDTDDNSKVLVVGAHRNSDAAHHAGCVYLYKLEHETLEWELVGQLFAHSPHSRQHFGYAVAMSKTTLVVGAILDGATTSEQDGNNDAAGAAYIFSLQQDGAWLEQARLVADDCQSGDAFGTSVAVSDGVVVVGAASHDTNGHANSGAAYVYTMHQDDENSNNESPVWTLRQKLSSRGVQKGDFFGAAVAISNRPSSSTSSIVVGASRDSRIPLFQLFDTGAAYVFERDWDIGSLGSGGFDESIQWTRIRSLFASDVTRGMGQFFGSALAIEGDTLVVGAFVDDDLGPNSGSVYLYWDDHCANWNLICSYFARRARQGS